MIIICDSKTPEDNKSYLSLFKDTIQLSPHSRIALTGATIPIEYLVTMPEYEVITGYNDTIDFYIRNNKLGTEGDVNNSSFPLNAGFYTIDMLINNVNERLNALNWLTGLPAPLDTNELYMTFGYDPCCEVFYFNIQVTDPKDADKPLESYQVYANDCQFLRDMGFFSYRPGIVNPIPPPPLIPNFGFNKGQSLAEFGGYIKGITRPYWLNSAYEDIKNYRVPFYISLPSFQVKTPVSALNIDNSKSIVHAFFYQPKFTFREYMESFYRQNDFNQFTPRTGIISEVLIYEPPLHQYVEINNDTITPMNDMRVEVLDNSGAPHRLVQTESNPNLTAINQNTTILVFELETEPEKQQEALRKVKDELRFQKFLKAVQHSLPF